MSRRVLIAGCGNVGIALGLRLTESGDTVYGLRRNAARLPAAIHPLTADLGDPDSLSRLPRHWDAVVYCPTPGERSEAGYRRVFVDGLDNLASHVEASRILFVSSTAVYGQNDGSWVDETSATCPGGFNGRVLLEGESLAAERFGEAVAVRFAGIYGPGRDRLLRMVRDRRSPVQADPPLWTNRIHRDDCARMLQALLGLADPLPAYIGVDDRPAPRREVLDWIARALGVPPLETCTVPGGDRNKRLSSDRIRATGFRFRYPDYRVGYGEMIDRGRFAGGGVGKSEHDAG